MPSDRELLTATYAAFNRRDIDAVLALMRPDVDWPNATTGDRVHGHEQVRGYWEQQWTRVDPCVEPVSIKADGTGKTVVEVHPVVSGSFRKSSCRSAGAPCVFHSGRPDRANGYRDALVGLKQSG